MLASTLLGACASTAPGGRAQLTAPAGISSLYSSIDMNMRLAAAPSVMQACTGVQCRVDKGFDHQVTRLGTRLAQSAYAADPDLQARVPAFTFVVADKSEAGSTSDTQGTIVIYRGVRVAGITEEALAFLIAREMGHVIARHHDERSATTLLLSLAAQFLMPLTSLTGGAAAIASTMASAVGTKLVSDDKKPLQSVEADTIAQDLLRRQGWSDREVAASLTGYARGLGDDAWSRAVKISLARYEPEEVPSVVLVAMNRPAWQVAKDRAPQ